MPATVAGSPPQHPVPRQRHEPGSGVNLDDLSSRFLGDMRPFRNNQRSRPRGRSMPPRRCGRLDRPHEWARDRPHQAASGLPHAQSFRWPLGLGVVASGVRLSGLPDHGLLERRRRSFRRMRTAARLLVSPALRSDARVPPGRGRPLAVSPLWLRGPDVSVGEVGVQPLGCSGAGFSLSLVWQCPIAERGRSSLKAELQQSRYSTATNCPGNFATASPAFILNSALPPVPH